MRIRGLFKCTYTCTVFFFFFLMIRRPPRSPLFPYTTPPRSPLPGSAPAASLHPPPAWRARAPAAVPPPRGGRFAMHPSRRAFLADVGRGMLIAGVGPALVEIGRASGRERV